MNLFGDITTIVNLILIPLLIAGFKLFNSFVYGEQPPTSVLMKFIALWIPIFIFMINGFLTFVYLPFVKYMIIAGVYLFIYRWIEDKKRHRKKKTLSWYRNRPTKNAFSLKKTISKSPKHNPVSKRSLGDNRPLKRF